MSIHTDESTKVLCVANVRHPDGDETFKSTRERIKAGINNSGRDC
jgi:hypothetical protein